MKGNAVTEAEWLACADPTLMLEWLARRPSYRKLRLFVCACCRRLWHLLNDDRSRRAIEVSERYADGLASQLELEAARAEALETVHERPAPRGRMTVGTRVWRDAKVAHAVASAAWCTVSSPHDYAHYAAQKSAWVAEIRGIVWAGEPWQCNLLRDILGNPFQPVTILPSWLTTFVTSLAQTIYDERRFQDLPILADALEEAGCTNPDILTHCRQPGEHVRGCWAIDLMLGKS
jgi:hypothetical protein